MKLAIAVLLSLTTTLAVCQNNNAMDAVILENSPWYEGSMMLKDGTELKGLLRYNDKTGVLNYQNGSETRSLVSRSLVAFEFFDESLGRQRIFYSLEEKDAESGVDRYYIFEVLEEFKDFAVLSKTEPVKVRQNNTPGGYNPGTGMMTTGTNRTELIQTEFIYFMSKDGKLDPYLKIVERDIDDAWFDRTRTTNKIIREEVISEYTGDAWPKLLEFVKEKDLSLKRKKDLMTLLEYYKTIVSP
jgi:hypothetical protein